MAKPKKPTSQDVEIQEDMASVPEAPVDAEDNVEGVEVVEAAEEPKEDRADNEERADDAENAQSDEAETVTEKSEPDAPIALQKVSSNGFVPLFLGGVAAGVIGFSVARYPDQWPFNLNQEDPVAVELVQMADRLSALETSQADQGRQIANLEESDALDRLRGETSGAMNQLRTTLDGLTQSLAELESRIHTVEKLPQGSGMEAAAAAAAAYERELQQMRQMLDDELARIAHQQDDAKTLEVSAAEVAKAAAARAAMSRIHAALETGQPFGDALFDLSESTQLDVPASLTSIADDGVPTQTALQASFPDAARSALDASIRAAVEGGSMNRMTAFFRTQLGARSLEPKEGDDPDAVLSRAEAALKAGDLSAALFELEAVPDAGKPALEEWIAQATTRKNVVAAAADLSRQLNSN